MHNLSALDAERRKFGSPQPQANRKRHQNEQPRPARWDALQPIPGQYTNLQLESRLADHQLVSATHAPGPSIGTVRGKFFVWKARHRAAYAV